MAKVVAVTQKERRRDLRRRVDFDGLVNDGPVSVMDISASGVGARVLDTPGPMAVGDEGYEIELIPRGDLGALDDGATSQKFVVGSEATLRLLKDGEEVLSITIEIVRFDEEADSLGARFINIDIDQYSIIERLVTGRPIKR